MLFLIIYSLIVLSILGGICYGLYAMLHPIGRIRVIVFPLLLVVAIGLFPIPIHGGFTTVAAVVADGLEDLWAERENEAKDRQNTAWHEKFRNRLPQPARFTDRAAIGRDWFSVRLEDQTQAFWDKETGLIWLDVMVSENSGVDQKSLVRTCSQSGHFTLPLEIEMYAFYRREGPRVMPFAEARYPSLLIDRQMQFETVKWRIFKRHENSASHNESVMVRCVGRTQKVPAEGLIDMQISRSEWNEFQLQPIR